MEKFPDKLKLIVENIDSKIANWDKEGTIFNVIDPEKFMEILSQNFKYKNKLSFFKQLQNYGFRRQAWAFYHKFFRRDSLNLMINIKREGIIVDSTKPKQKIIKPKQKFGPKQESEPKIFYRREGYIYKRDRENFEKFIPDNFSSYCHSLYDPDDTENLLEDLKCICT